MTEEKLVDRISGPSPLWRMHRLALRPAPLPDVSHSILQLSIYEGEPVFKHILISTDGSPVSNKAAKAGIALAHRLGAKVTAYCALEEPHSIYIEGYSFSQEEIDGFDQRSREAGQKRVDAIGRMAKAAGVPFTPVVAKALTPYEGIIATAKKRKCDVIFMASHGLRGLSKLIMGSVTQKVLAHSSIPVVVYR
jgi:nucleotide-binding universal stress UspA family protein